MDDLGQETFVRPEETSRRSGGNRGKRWSARIQVQIQTQIQIQIQIQIQTQIQIQIQKRQVGEQRDIHPTYKLKLYKEKIKISSTPFVSICPQLQIQRYRDPKGRDLYIMSARCSLSRGRSDCGRLE